MRRQCAFLAATLVVIAGCYRANAPSVAASVVAASATDLDALIAKQSSVTFRSFNGKWIGMDGDTELMFLPNQNVLMIEFGYAVIGYSGTYKIDPSGQITLHLPTFGQAWPAMWLRKDSKSMLLIPVQHGNEFVMGNRGGATLNSEDGSYWPFRPLDAEDESKRREWIKQQSQPSAPYGQHFIVLRFFPTRPNFSILAM
jgi:hypothetical protein